jgi:hypothetical protein
LSLGSYGNRQPRDKANDSRGRKIESVLVQLGRYAQRRLETEPGESRGW